MTRYLFSFDDVKQRFKRLSNIFYNSTNDTLSIQSPTKIGANAQTNINANPILLVQGNSDTDQVYIQSWSNENRPSLSFERRRDNGATVQNGDNLGSVSWKTATSASWGGACEIAAIYTGNGATSKARLKFSTSAGTALLLNDDLSVSFFNSSNTQVGLKIHASSAYYTLTLPENAGSQGQVLTTDGAGNLTWDNRTNVEVTDYAFDSDDVGQTTFDTGIALTTQKIIVTENGVVKREGLANDWTRSGTTIVFNYTVKNAWVNATVYSAVALSDFHFDTDNNGSTAFNTGVTLTGKRVMVYINGALARQGASFDYTFTGTTVTTNYSVKNSWVVVLVYT